MTDFSIRRTTVADAEALANIYGGSNAYMNTLQLPMPTVQMWHDRLSTHTSDQHSLIAENDSGALGHIMLYTQGNVRRRHVGSFGMGVLDEAQGQGVGSALLTAALDLADNWLNLKRIEITVFIDNDAAIALYKKFGFTVEGESKMFAFRNGAYVDTYHMARINP